MASSKYQWSDYIDSKNILDVSKMFFDRFLCRAHFRIPAARRIEEIIEKSEDEFSSNLTKKFAAHAVSGLLRRRESDINLGNPHHLFQVHELCSQFKNRCKTYIHGENFYVYLETEDCLSKFLSHPGAGLVDYVVSIQRPASQEAAEHLKNKTIFVKNAKYQYKIIVREGKYEHHTKEQIIAYLDQFDESIVMLPGKFKARLEAPDSKYVHGYFYTNDPGVFTFMGIIDPTFATKIYRLEETQNK